MRAILAGIMYQPEPSRPPERWRGVGVGLGIIAVVAPLIWVGVPRPLLIAVFVLGVYLIVRGVVPELRRFVATTPSMVRAIWREAAMEGITDEARARVVTWFRFAVAMAYWALAVPGVAALSYFTTPWVIAGWFIVGVTFALIVELYEEWTGRQAPVWVALYAGWLLFVKLLRKAVW